MQTVNRRQLIRGVVATAVAATPVNSLKAQESQRSRQLSSAVFEQLRLSAVRASQHASQGQTSGGDLRLMAAALNTYFNHLDETGVTELFENAIRTMPVPIQTWDQMNHIREIARKVGVEVSDAAWSFMYQQQTTELPQIKAFVEANGLKAFHQGLISNLYSIATRMDGAAKLGSARLIEAGWWSCWGGAVAGLYLTTWQVLGFAGGLPALTAVLATPAGQAAVIAITAALAIYGVYCAFA